MDANVQADSTVDEGIRLYLDGNLREAKTYLQEVISSGISPDREIEALIYLAEIEYYLGERDAAWLTCQRIVQANENYRPDPLVHPPEMLVFFENARLSTVEEPNTTTSRLENDQTNRRLSALTFVPGMPQYLRGDRALGITAGVSFTSLTVASIILWATLNTFDTDSDRQGIQVQNDNDFSVAQKLLTATEITRWSAAGIWVASLTHELTIRPTVSAWDNERRATLSINGSW